MTVTSPPPEVERSETRHQTPREPPAGKRRGSHVRKIPLARIVGVELRKSFDTRAGFWLVAGIGIASLLTTSAVIAFADASELTYGTFALATGFPLTVILPMIAVLSVTSEWSQRTGLTTFTLVPHRSRVMLAKAVGSGPGRPGRDGHRVRGRARWATWSGPPSRAPRRCGTSPSSTASR